MQNNIKRALFGEGKRHINRYKTDSILPGKAHDKKLIKQPKEKKDWQEPQYSAWHAELIVVSIYYQSAQNIHICPQFIIKNMLEQRDNTQIRNINGMVHGYISRSKERNVNTVSELHGIRIFIIWFEMQKGLQVLKLDRFQGTKVSKENCTICRKIFALSCLIYFSCNLSYVEPAMHFTSVIASYQNSVTYSLENKKHRQSNKI